MRTVVLELNEHDARELLRLVHRQTEGRQVWRAYWLHLEQQLQEDINKFYEQLFAERG